MIKGFPLTLETLRKEFGDLVAVDDISLNIKSGECVSLLGPSGCGKTTTLYMIAGLLEPTSGKIFIGDRDVTDLPPQKRDVGLVFQYYAVFSHMSVYDNLAYGLKIRKNSKQEIKSKVKEVSEKFGLDNILEKKAGKVSLDEQQKVALSRTLLVNPKILLLDESLSAIDPSLRPGMRSEIKRIQKEFNQTLIYVTHDQIEAMAISDRIALMNRGELMQVSTPKQLYNSPENLFVAGFIGQPSMNMIECELKEKNNNYFLDASAFTYNIDVKTAHLVKDKSSTSHLVLGVRPEDIKVSHQKAFRDSLRGDISLIEPLGNRTIFHLKVGDIILRSLIHKTVLHTTSKSVWFGFNKDKIHIFDKKSKTVIL